jgi:hypothetical protein
MAVFHLTARSQPDNGLLPDAMLMKSLFRTPMEYHFLANSACTFNWQFTCDYTACWAADTDGRARERDFGFFGGKAVCPKPQQTGELIYEDIDTFLATF